MTTLGIEKVLTLSPVTTFSLNVLKRGVGNELENNNSFSFGNL